jgi:hypothetical protein
VAGVVKALSSNPSDTHTHTHTHPKLKINCNYKIEVILLVSREELLWVFFFFFVVWGLNQSYTLNQPFSCEGFFEIGSYELFAPGWLPTSILLISAS